MIFINMLTGVIKKLLCSNVVHDAQKIWFTRYIESENQNDII